MFALVDANNAYVSFQRVFEPRLRGRPVVVLSANDGACIARSNEAKELGVAMAQPWFQVRHLERTAGLIALSANFELYGDMSARLMAIVGRFAPRQEIYSIDESFLDFEGVRGDLRATGHVLRETVQRELGVPTCVGLGPTKTLAKFGNHIAKTAERKPGTYPAEHAGVCHVGLLEPAQREALFAATPVGEIWGIGRRINAKLTEAGVRTVLDFVRCDAATLRKHFSVVVEKTLLEMQGTACLSVDDAPAPRQQILVSRSFGQVVTSLDGIIEAVSEFAARGAEKLRQQHSAAGAIQVFITTSPFRKGDRQHSPSATMPLAHPTADTRLLVRTAADAVRRTWRPGFNYTKAGVMLLDLQPADIAQGELDLFSEAAAAGQVAPADANQARLMAALDAVNKRFGRDSLRLGTQAMAQAGTAARGWSSKQERRSARFTTRWDEMPAVRC